MGVPPSLQEPDYNRLSSIRQDITTLPWPEPSKLHANLQAARPLGNSWLQKLLVSQPLLQGVSRSHIGTGLAQSPSGRLGDTRIRLSCSSGRCHSSGWSERLPKISRQTSDFSRQLSWHYKKLVRLTWWVCLRTPTSAPSTPSGLP